MDTDKRLKRLRLALRVLGLIFVFGVYPLTVFWPAGWAWHHGRSEYLEMIMVLYATLGLFCCWSSAVVAARSEINTLRPCAQPFVLQPVPLHRR